jgi:integrase
MGSEDKEFPFTKAKISGLPLPKPGERARYYDTKSKGLCLRVASGGSKSFTYYRKIGGKVYSKKIGEFPSCTIERARVEVDKINGAIAQGKNPLEQALSATSETTLGELFDQYIKQYAADRCSTANDMVDNFNRYFGEWRSRPLSSFKRIDIQARINKLGADGKKHTANRSHDLIRAVFSWGIKKGLFAGENPCIGVDKFKLQARERFIRPEEFKAFFKALAAENKPDDDKLHNNFHDYVLLSLYTGARQANVLSMRWEDVDFKTGHWRIPKTKNKDSHTVPLTPYAVDILKCRKDKAKTNGPTPYVFPSDSAVGHYTEPKVAWRHLLKNAKLIDLRMHDLRRTMGSYMAMNNQSLPIIGKALGHKSHVSTQIYARLALDPVRAAMVQAQEQMLGAAQLEEKGDE